MSVSTEQSDQQLIYFQEMYNKIEEKKKREKRKKKKRQTSFPDLRVGFSAKKRAQLYLLIHHTKCEMAILVFS